MGLGFGVVSYRGVFFSEAGTLDTPGIHREFKELMLFPIIRNCR